MKKALIISLLLVFGSLFSYAKVTEENYFDDVKTLSCGSIILDYPIINGVSLSYSATLDGDNSYSLYLFINNKNIEISAGRKVLIKLSDGSILEFVNPIKKDLTSPLVAYDIPDSEMEQLVSKRITKIRVEHDSGYIDQDINDDELSRALKQMYGELQEAISNILFVQGLTDRTFPLDGIRELKCDVELLDYPIINAVLLSCYVKPNGDCSYTLFLFIKKDNVQISEGRKLLIKFEDGSILELTSTMKKEATETCSVYEDIPESEMKEIVSKRITKIRVEHDSGYLDQDINDDVLSNALKQMYDKIQKVLTNSKKDIYSDF